MSEQKREMRRRRRRWESVRARKTAELRVVSEPACHWCGVGLTFRGEADINALVVWATVDHVVSLAAGGSNEIDNLVFACAPCNGRRGATERLETL